MPNSKRLNQDGKIEYTQHIIDKKYIHNHAWHIIIIHNSYRHKLGRGGPRGNRALRRKERRGDDRSMKIKSLEAAKIMKIKRLVLGCIEADFCS